jgi:cell division protein FtsL
LKAMPRAVLWIAVPLLWVSVLGSAAAAIYCKHRARQLFVEIEKLNRGRDELEAEWGRLQLEQSSWSTYSYVESIADAKLHMSIPASAAIEIAAR